ncbi:uncharacterized protein LOC129912638 [Episyrphus balteatus]|uniref:uncharacterized protein LOC129912638 n=1 Tax=Episyrphus balteatus TaxID=286459 RepID=UPI0024865085|nr:uncharacterized protein LOC129912638 [Episyrphus balteatus]
MPCSFRDYDIYLERLESYKGENATSIEYKIRLTRLGHGNSYAANGYMIYKEDLYSDVQHSIKTFYSSDGSTQFRSYPYTIQSSNICKFFKTNYRQYGQSWIKPHTNFPYIPEEGICPLPKGKYYSKNLTFEDVPLPTHAPRGLWKFDQRFERNGKLIGGLMMYARVTAKW